MKVTVVVPCYNQEKYIKDCLDALLNQTRPADEILVINDGSNDKSMEIVNQYQEIRIINHEGNKGLATARNTGYKHADGEIVVYVDSDANADPEMLENLLKEYNDPGVSGVGGRGIEANIASKFDLWRKIHSSQQSGEELIPNHKWLWGLCSSYRKSALAAVGGFDVFYRTNAEDVDIGYRLTKKGFRLVYTPYAKVFHQRQDNFKSLHKMVMRWYYWGYVAKYRNGSPPGKEYYRIINSALWRNLRYDLLRDHDFGLAFLDKTIYLARMYAVTKACFDCWRGKHDS